jgi:hypothetical protein
MSKTRHTEAQIIGVLKQLEAGRKAGSRSEDRVQRGASAQQFGVQNPERVCSDAGGGLLHSWARGKGFKRHPLPLALPHPGSNRRGSN